MDKRIAIIGYGAIGAEVANHLSQDRDPGFELAVLLRPGSGRVLPPQYSVLTGHDALLAFAPDLVIEAAGHAAVTEYGPPCLAHGIPFLASSVGALADATLFDALLAAARHGGTQLVLPAGAVAALDYFAAVKPIDGTRVEYTSRKPAAAWKAELAERGIDPAALKAPVELFRGSAREAALAYPLNLNVAATIALAGGGLDATTVKVVADPAAKGNTHEVDVSGPAGTMTLRLANKPSPANPKSSWLTALSVVAAARNHFSPLRLG